MPRTLLILLALSITLPAAAQDIFADRPAFSEPDQIRAMSEGLPPREARIDLAATGDLTAVKGDGALWYLVICDDVRLMCVTYESNDMKVGERVFMRGGYRRLDARHAVLDPCLASRNPPE